MVENPGLPLEFGHHTRTSGLGGHCSFRLSDVVKITAFELAEVDSRELAFRKKHYNIVFLLKRLGGFFYSKRQRTRVKTEAQYMMVNILAYNPL